MPLYTWFAREQAPKGAIELFECSLTPPPKHWSAREKRTASRPRIAALSLRHAAWNVIARLHMFVAAASRDGSRSGGSAPDALIRQLPPLRPTMTTRMRAYALRGQGQTRGSSG